MYGKAKALELLDRVVRHDASAAADGIEASLSGARNQYTRIANNAIIQDSIVDDAALSIRANVNGALGSTTTNDLSDEGIARAINRAIDAAKASGNGSFPGFVSEGQAAELPQAFDEETAFLSGGEKSAALAPSFDKARNQNLLIAGSFHTGVKEIAIANSAGLHRYHRGTTADARINALAGLAPGQSTSYAGKLDMRFSDIDLTALCDRAMEKTEIGRNPKTIDAGAYDVLLEPEAVAELLEWMGFVGFSSRAMEDESSFLTGKIGEKVTGDDVTLIDDGPAAHGHGIPMPFDGEGTPKATITLVDKGVGRTGVFDRATAARLGCSTTGHANFGAGAMDSGAAPANLMMVGGDHSHDQLLNRLDKGLWVTRFHYVNGMLEPRRAVMTGLTRDGLFWVEGGKVQHGLRNLRFTDSILEAFQRIGGLSSALQPVPTWWSELGAVTAPAVLIRGLKFTGTTDE